MLSTRLRALVFAVLVAALAISVSLLAPAQESAPTSAAASVVVDGAAITPAVADALFQTLAPLHESDGCRVLRFDTSRFRITVGLQARSGAQAALDLATAPARGYTGRRAGGWALAVPPELERDCPATLAAMERALSPMVAPREPGRGPEPSLRARASYALLEASFLLLVLGTVALLYREARRARPPWLAVLALVVVWGAALALRVRLSPHTFLHEYYHVAETVSGYQTGEIAPVYGNAGPALFRLVGRVLGRPEDVRIIFATNAVVSSLAIPAVALLDLALMRSWPRAICAAVLLCVLPQHLRLSAGEDLFVQAVTLGLWSLGILVVYVRTRRLADALLGVLALSLAMQTRPEMLLFPVAVVALVLLAEPRAWHALLNRRTLLALAVLGALLVPRFLAMRRSLAGAPSLAPALSVSGYLDNLVLFQHQVTPAVYWALLAVGLGWGALRGPGFHLWAILLFLGHTLLSLSLFRNPIYDLRSQLLPAALVVMIAAGTAPVWMGLWGHRRRLALCVGACALAGLGATVVLSSRGFVTELRDQQLEWAFLEQTVPRLPPQGTLLSAVDVGGAKLDAFPTFLLSRAGKDYETVDVRDGDAWPAPGGEGLLYYQGMFCYFAFPDEPSPDPMTASCKAVHERYALEPLFVEDLQTTGYSDLRYAGGGKGPFRIGFFRLGSR